MGVLTAAVCLLAAVGVGCRPVISPLNDAKVECIVQETLNGDGSQHECNPQLAAELDEVQRHQSLLGELQRLADDERERYEYNLADEESDLEPKDEGSDAAKTTVEGEPKKREMDEPRIDDTGIHDEEEKAKELEELLAEEISKKEKEERNDEELKELLRELKKKRYEMKERGSQNSPEKGQEEDDTKPKMARDKKEVQQQSVADQRKDEVELSVEKEKVEKELMELKNKNKPEEERTRKEKQEELDELVKKMQRVQEETQTEKKDDDVDHSKHEEEDEDDKRKDDNGGGKGGQKEVRSKEGAVEVKEPQQKRVMEKASDEATRQFERERFKDDEEDDQNGEDEEDENEYIREDEDDEEGGLEEDDGEIRHRSSKLKNKEGPQSQMHFQPFAEQDKQELLEIEAQLREVAAELRELRRG
ncbi:trichohyalin isoform X2 [Phycodurus eques]|uniref:trichohyalin isoform X2 n=1 Tax=Phycodurus eques TaxID=693459 RepID=UPI002ACED0FB|nr:trichohyalin isoform X2 [Phycodurus eques]